MWKPMFKPGTLVDVPERRSVPFSEFETRTQGNTARVSGYASVFGRSYPIYGGPDAGGFNETVNRGAFDRTLRENADVVLLENHAGGPLARTKSGTLRLSTDSTGLLHEAELDLRDPQAKSVFVKIDRNDYSEMSIGFRVRAQTWSDDETERGLNEIQLHRGDLSYVTYGASPTTSIALRRMLSRYARGELDDREVAELRALLSVRAMSSMMDDAGLEDDDTTNPNGSLAQAVHDLARDAGALCAQEDIRSARPARRSGSLTVAEAEAMGGPVRSGRRVNLTVSEAARMCG